MATPESELKRYVRDTVTGLGWYHVTLRATHVRGWPDTTWISPPGNICFVELKAEGARHNVDHLERQRKTRVLIRSYGLLAFLAVGRGGVDQLIRHLQTEHGWTVF